MSESDSPISEARFQTHHGNPLLHPQLQVCPHCSPIHPHYIDTLSDNLQALVFRSDKSCGWFLSVLQTVYRFYKKLILFTFPSHIGQIFVPISTSSFFFDTLFLTLTLYSFSASVNILFSGLTSPWKLTIIFLTYDLQEVYVTCPVF